MKTINKFKIWLLKKLLNSLDNKYELIHGNNIIMITLRNTTLFYSEDPNFNTFEKVYNETKINHTLRISILDKSLLKNN